MKVIILAAGIGSRAYPLTKDTPKCLLKIGTKTILEHNLGLLAELDIRNISIVTGFQEDKIKRELSNKGFGFVNSISNPLYKLTNSIASLSLALAYLNLEEEVLILNADICFSKEILCLTLKGSNFILCDSSKKCTDADYKVVADLKGNVKNMGKLIDGDTYFGEYAGVVKLALKNVPTLKNIITDMLKAEKFDTWYETALLEAIKKKKLTLKIKDIAGLDWVEIDKVADLKKAKSIFRGTKHMGSAV